MTDDLCPREADVLRASESSVWSETLRTHLATCAACREVEAVASALRLAVDHDDADALPSADQIWWRAQLQARRDAEARALRPLDTVERAEPLVVLVAIVTAFVLRGDAIMRWLGGWIATDATGQAIQTILPPALMPILLIGAGLGALVMAVGVGAVLARD